MAYTIRDTHTDSAHLLNVMTREACKLYVCGCNTGGTGTHSEQTQT